MERPVLELSKQLIKKPKKFKPPHFSLPLNSYVISLKEKDKGTRCKETTVRITGSSRQKAPTKRKKALSMNDDARRKRKSRSNPTVRKAENRRRNAANALKRSDPEYQKELAEKKRKYKEEKSKRDNSKANLLAVNTAATALQPFSSRDDAEGEYEITRWREVVVTNYEKHSFSKKKKVESLIDSSQYSLVNIQFDNKGPAQAQTITPL